MITDNLHSFPNGHPVLSASCGVKIDVIEGTVKCKHPFVKNHLVQICMLFLTLQTSLHYCSLYLKFTVKFCRANVGNKWKTWSALHSDIFQSKLSQRFKVQGIPTLIMVNCEDGSVITRDGRQCVVDDPEGKEFPWRPKPLGEIVEGVLINSKGEETKWGDLASKIVGFYFSAHWVSDKFSYQNLWIQTWSSKMWDQTTHPVELL